MEPGHSISCKIAFVPSEDADPHVNPRSQPRVFAGHPVGSEGSKVSADTLNSLGGCVSWSESSLGAHALLSEMMCAELSYG